MNADMKSAATSRAWRDLVHIRWLLQHRKGRFVLQGGNTIQGYRKMETTTEAPRKLYKSRQNRIIDGICGGVAEYFGIDATIVRILWVLITIMGGAGFLLYIAGMIVIPTNPEHWTPPGMAPVRNGTDKKRFWGVFLVLLGAFILMINLGWFAEYHWWSFSRTVLLPILLILVGGLLIYSRSRRADSGLGMDSSGPAQGFSALPQKELRRSVLDRKLFGVCGGIAKYFEIDSTIVRILFIVLVISSFGWGLLLYIILGLLMPEERLTTSST